MYQRAFDKTCICGFEHKCLLLNVIYTIVTTNVYPMGVTIVKE